MGKVVYGDKYPHLLETMLEEKIAYEGKIFRVRQDHVQLSDGQEAYREFVVHPGASCILAFVSPSRLVMVRQYRYPVKQVMLELPAGKLSIGEPALNTAMRELEEETGFRAKEWTALGHCLACIGYGDEAIHYFAATQLSQHGAKPDSGELVDTLEMDVTDIMNAIDTGDITDSKTIAGLMIAQRKGLIKH